MEIKITMADLQEAVTAKFAEALCKRNPATPEAKLARLGFLGTSVRTSMNETRLYIESALVKELNVVGKTTNPALEFLQRGMVTDDVRDHLFVSDRRVPAYKIHHPAEKVFRCEISEDSYKNREVLVIQFEPFQLLAYLMNIDLSDVHPADVRIIPHVDSTVPVSKVTSRDRKVESQKTVDYLTVILPDNIRAGFTYEGLVKFMNERKSVLKGERKTRKHGLKETGKTFIQPTVPRTFGI